MAEPTATPDQPAVGRRRFLTYVIAAPTLTMGASLSAETASEATPGLPDIVDLTDALVLAAAPTVHNLVVEITPANRVVVQLPREEVGQGITTTFAMIVAEELDARLADVEVRLQDATPANLMNQLTGGSASVSVLYQPMREVTAAMRARLVTAAAHRWGLPAGSLSTRDTMVIAPDGRTAGYGSLSADAARVLLPEVSAAPKDPTRFTVIGTPRNRIDALDIVTGRARYTHDLDVPGAKPTVVARPPTIRGTVASVDDSVARGMPGVLAVTRIPTGVAVTAETFDQAQQARDALKITWNPGPVAGMSDVDIRTRLRAAAPPFVLPPLGTLTVEGEFSFAFLNHAPLEVMGAIADVRADRAEVWMRSKSPIPAQAAVAAAVGLPQSAVTLHPIRGGGSFGRGLFFDAGPEAALVSKAIGRPVKLLYTRADDMHHGRMRPASFHRVRATYLLGTVLSYEHRVGAVELDLRHGFGDVITALGAGLLPGPFAQTVFHLTQNMPYNFGVETYLLGEVPLGVATSSWRSIYSGAVAVADEIMVDEIARRLGQDPVAFRLARLSGARERAVVQKVATEGGWGRALPPGHAQGVAIHEEYKGCAAVLVELDATGTEPRVTKAVVAVDVGRAINPRGLEAQLAGVVVDGISATLRAGNHIDNGAVRESSFTDFKWARMRHSPLQTEVHVMPPSTGKPGGAGELGFPAAAAAVANAYARATGTRPRSFPIAG
ncbi:MAG TPA: molybdopterin cofactor-binding domain-containing protein [Actinophytocola sp.]|jgi:isoquinoline 1-oxidoreductase beta subunit|uniref:xanthine dehydrogenase family protein molybdopterin-binding subunit n=1 Tax=Actinophytocola sp. TaxID=1872138 RepID=UPI002DF9575B|nr:molybdopterin cofactor-binding domain-containing protein [Actinophytocola sp.]